MYKSTNRFRRFLRLALPIPQPPPVPFPPPSNKLKQPAASGLATAARWTTSLGSFPRHTTPRSILDAASPLASCVGFAGGVGVGQLCAEGVGRVLVPRRGRGGAASGGDCGAGDASSACWEMELDGAGERGGRWLSGRGAAGGIFPCQ